LSPEDKKKVIDGRQQSSQQQQQSQQVSTQGTRGGRGGGGGRNLSVTNIVTQDEPSAISGPTMAQDLDQSILQGTLQGSAAVGEKRSMADTAGSQMSRRHRINKVVTSGRKIKMHNISQVQQHPRYYELDSTVQGPCELDTHADTCVAGANCIILEESNQTVNVNAFTDTHEPLTNVPIVTAARAYDDEITGTTYILILGQAIYLGNQMKNSLICPNQLRANGLIVEDCPKHLAPRDKPSSHSIFVPEDNLTIPLQLKGVTSYFTTRTPTINEVETCQWVHLSNDQDWDPHSETHQNQEYNYEELNGWGEYLDRQIFCTQTSTQVLHNTVMETISYAFNDHNIICAMNTSRHDMSITAKTIANNWSIALENAKKTMRFTTQKGVRNTLYPIECRFRTRQAQLRYSQLSGRHGRFYTNTFFASVPTLNGCKMAQIFVNDLNFTKVYPMQTKSETSDTLKAFIHDVGIPHALHSDDAKEFMQGSFKQLCKDYNIPCTYTEPYSPWQNRAEGGIRELKRHVHQKMTSKKVPQRLWDFCCKWSCEVRNKSAGKLYQLEGRTPFEAVMGNTPDISSLVSHDFYDYVWYYDQTPEFPAPRKKVGRWIGEAHSFGKAMCYWILSKNAEPIVRSTIQAIPEDELTTEDFKTQVQLLDDKISSKFGEPPSEDSIHTYNLDNPNDEEGPEHITPEYVPVDPECKIPDADQWEPESYDQYIAAEVRLPKDGNKVIGTVVARKRDHDVNPVGCSHPNPILDTRVYQVTFPDGNSAEYSANMIAECLYSQVDDEGRQYLLLEAIVDHKRTVEALANEEIFQVSYNGNIHKRMTTKGWKLCVTWKDGSTSWETLADMKHSFPVQVAEYAMANKLQDSPAFRWWVPDVLKRKMRMIKAVKSRYMKKTHKYGIHLPKTVAEAYQIDQETNTDYWHQAIMKEMKNNAVAFQFLEEGESLPVGSKWIPFHMIFDIKCDFTRKARFVAGGHWTNAPDSITYSSIVTRDSVQIGFLLAALNDLDILAADVGNAYLQAPAREKVHTMDGPEFGPSNVGKTVIIIRAMYGLKSSGAAWHAKLSDTLRGMNFRPSYADPDVWMRPATKYCGFQYYEYILVYVDDILVISASPSPVMKTIQKAYRLKEEPCPPKTYLGAAIKSWTLPGEVKPIWSMNCIQYLKEAIRNVEQELSKSGLCLRGKPNTPMQTGYRLELDISPVLGPDQANYYQSLIGILRWAVELGRIDIYVDVALLSSHLVEPHTGHLAQVLHIFSFLKAHLNSHLVFDPNYVAWENASFKKYDWREFYSDAKEAIPPNAPSPRGHPVEINAFVDANHAGNKVTRQSHTGILIYLNCAPIVWYSKAQTTVETSTFGSEFIAMRILVEILEAMRYKLRMLGVPIDGRSNVFCNNKSVVTNVTIPTSTLKKKHNSIAYHRVREAVAAGILQVAKVHSSENLADLLTKSLPGVTLKKLIQKILW